VFGVRRHTTAGAQVYEHEEQAARSPTDCTEPPEDAAAARSDGTYTGTYDNDYYGPLTVTASDVSSPCSSARSR
jgi:hypothetical protein